MPPRFFARVFGNPAGDPVLLKSRGVTLLRDKPHYRRGKGGRDGGERGHCGSTGRIFGKKKLKIQNEKEYIKGNRMYISSLLKAQQQQ